MTEPEDNQGRVGTSAYETPPQGVQRWVTGNVGWLSSLALVMFVILKVHRVSRLSLTTAEEVVRSYGAPEVALGVLLDNADLIVYLLATSIIAMAIVRNVPKESAWAVAVAICVTGIVMALVSSWKSTLVYAVVMGWNLIVFWTGAPGRAIGPAYDASVKIDRVSRRLVRKRRHRHGAFLVVPTTFLVFLTLLNSEPWLPRERIGSSSGEKVIAFVLKEGDPWTVLLLDDDRSVVRWKTDDITSREACVLSAHSETPTVLELLAGERRPARYRRCSTLT